MIVLVLVIIIVDNIQRIYNKWSSNSDNDYKRSYYNQNSNNIVIAPSEVVTIISIMITTNVAVVLI